MKGFGHVIVSACIETLDLVAPAVAGSQHEHGHRAAGATPRLKDGNAIHLRETDIQNDRVVRLRFAQIVPFLAIERAVDDVSGVGQRGGKLTVKIWIVLDHEEAHGSLLR
jgi:hypothetical protein